MSNFEGLYPTTRTLFLCHPTCGVQSAKTTGTSGEVWNPGQWLSEDHTTAVMNDDIDHMPFGTGPQRCPGRNIATTGMIAKLALLARCATPPNPPRHFHFCILARCIFDKPTDIGRVLLLLSGHLMCFNSTQQHKIVFSHPTAT